MGAVATLLLHSLFIAVAMWGTAGVQRHPDRPDAIGTGANRGTPEGASAERRMTVRLITDIEAGQLPPPPEAFRSELLREALKLEITGPDSLPLPPLIIEPGDPAESSDAELIARTKMMGIYENQIRARIERAWRLPEGSNTDDAFSCRVLIRQHRDGRVAEVEMPYEECSGSPTLRQSLVNAIFSASPLPAPPHPGVFVDVFSLVLRSGSVIRH